MKAIDPGFVTTALELPGYRVVRCVGVVRGLIVRSRSVVGNITLYTNLCERARGDAYRLMVEHAAERGANAVICMRYDANEIMAGVTEVLAYGTAVVVEPA